jgi:hypothetical protein
MALPRKRETAAEAHVRNMASIHRHLADIVLWCSTRADSSDVNWEDVGDVAHYEEKLRDVADAITKRGEYADPCDAPCNDWKCLRDRMCDDCEKVE